MGELRRQARLADEAVAEVRAVGEVAGENLDRDRTVELLVLREIDGRHPAAAEDVLEPVAPACERLGAQSPSPVVVPVVVPVTTVRPPSCLSWPFPLSLSFSSPWESFDGAQLTAFCRLLTAASSSS